MTLTLNPGCFGSALCAQASSETCQVCPVREECFAQVDLKEHEVMARLTRLMTLRGDGGLARVQRFIAIRKVRKTAAKSGNARSDKLLLRFQSDGIDLSALRSSRNPFDVQTDPLHFWMADFVKKGFPFKPKDVTEHVQANCQSALSTGSIKSEVARFASALVAAGILQRKDAYILCLVT